MSDTLICKEISSWVVDLGHTAYFTINRGTVSNRWQVTCNKQLEINK